jgi:hypothetical protein
MDTYDPALPPPSAAPPQLPPSTLAASWPWRSTPARFFAVLNDTWPREPFDPGFLGQCLETYYLDTPRFNLRKARVGRDRYLTLRIRTYRALATGH